MSENDDGFDLAGYGVMVDALLNRGFEIRGYANAKPEKPHLILRHDIDFDLGAAVKLATLEAQQGWKSSYFVLTCGEFYNPLSPATRSAIVRLGGLGHSVGLHFDAASHDADPDRLNEAVERECAILEDISGTFVEAFSLHRPHPDLLNHGFEVPGRINVYAPSFIRDMGYCSDSRGGWHHGPPLEHPAIVAGRALQLLTHPVWWTQSGATPHDKCVEILKGRAEFLDSEMARNCQAYQGRR